MFLGETFAFIFYIVFYYYMKNFKKLFSIIAIVAMAATSVPTATLGAASYSDELQGAYDYAYGIGITTQSSIDSANMYGSLIRSHMAKMMVNYATEVLGQTPDTNVTCEFTDVANESDELQGYITEACQLGLMGVGITAFNPNGVVTRAQFGTVLSRALYGDIYNDGDPYYVNHLEALRDAGVMNNISNPNANEVRGYVMLMMQRAADNETPAVCETPENVLSCSLGLDTCPTECETNNDVKAGTLTVDATAVDYTSIPATGAVKHATVTFKAGSDDVSVYSVQMKKTSLATLGSDTRMYFVKNGLRVTSKAAFSEDKATLSFSTAFVVKAGATETLDLYLYVAGSAGDEYQFTSLNVDSSAAEVNGTITTPLMRTVNYTLADVTFTPVTDTNSFKVDSTNLVELGSFRIANNNPGTKNLLFKGITIYQNGTADLSYLENLGLYRDEVKISDDVTVDGRNISFKVDDTIKYTSSSATYVIKGEIANADRINDTYAFLIKNPENVDLTESTTAFKVSVVNPTTTIILSTITVIGADLTFNQLTTSYTKQITPGAKTVVFFTGTLKSLEQITLENFSGAMQASVSGLNDVFTTIYMKVGNTVLSTTAPSNTDGTASSIQFEGTVVVNGTVPFMIYADIKDTAVAQRVKFNAGVSLASFVGTNEYSNGEAITSAIGSLSPITNTIAAANLNFTNTTTSAKTVQKNDMDITMADLEFSTTTDIISKVYSFRATFAGTDEQNFAGGVVTVYDKNGTALVSDSIETNTGSLVFVLPTALAVSKGNPVQLKVKLDRVANTVTGNDSMKLIFGTVNAKNIITTDTINPSPTTLDSVTLNAVNAGTVSVVAQSFSPILVKMNGSTATIGTLKFRPYNGNVTLKDLTLTGTDTTPFSVVVLKDGTNTVATFIKIGTTGLWIDNINLPLTTETKTYTVEATLKTASTYSDLIGGYALTLNSANFESLNGAAIAATVVPATVGSSMYFVKAKPTVTYVAMAQGWTKAYYKFTIKAEGWDIQMTGFKFNLTNNTDTLSGWVVTLWMDNEGGTTLATGVQDAIPTVADSFTFDSLLSTVNISDWETKTFILAMPITTWMKSTVYGNVNVELTNITYADTFNDTTMKSHADIFTTYLWDIAPLWLSASLKNN